jgi:hypothetical protein
MATDNERPYSDVLRDFMKAADELYKHPEAPRHSYSIAGGVLRFMQDEPEKFAPDLDKYEFPDELD